MIVAKSRSSVEWIRRTPPKGEIASSSLAGGDIRVGVVGNISACHADARGSIPRLGVL